MSGRLAITVGEFGDRFRRLQATVASEGLDAFVVSSFESICYLTGKG